MLQQNAAVDQQNYSHLVPSKHYFSKLIHIKNKFAKISVKLWIMFNWKSNTFRSGPWNNASKKMDNQTDKEKSRERKREREREERERERDVGEI